MHLLPSGEGVPAAASSSIDFPNRRASGSITERQAAEVSIVHIHLQGHAGRSATPRHIHDRGVTGRAMQWPGPAQDPAPDASVTAMPGLPGIEQLVAALATPETRRQALLDMAAVANARQKSAGLLTGTTFGASFADDREWLGSQVDRFGWFEPRSPVLDPAAWRVQLQLQPIGLANSALASPLGPGLETLLTQVFDRSDPLLAAVALPVLLWELETQASLIWSDVLARAGAGTG